MGIPRGLIKLLMREGKREEFSGSLLTLGRQNIIATDKDLQKWAKMVDFQLKSDIKMSISNNNYKRGYITDRVFFLSLGFDNIDSIDNSDFEQCTIVHDLNEDVPETLYNKYDFIYDGGTSEHIFNFPKVLENLNKMLKFGGRIIHSLPSSNCVDHGFYMFSPTLLYDYYSTNKWNIIDSFFLNYPSDEGVFTIYNYTPGCLDKFSYGGLKNKGPYTVFFIAKKTEDSTFNASVQQGLYLKIWSPTSNQEAETLNTSWKKRITSKFPKSLQNILRYLYNKTQSNKRKFDLEIIDKY